MRTPLRFGAVALALAVTFTAVVVARQTTAPRPTASTSLPSAAALKPTVKTPPLNSAGYALARPESVTRAVYDFVAKHPEVSRFVPCFCGCEHDGHKSNESCFIGARDAAGNVTRWDTHGFGCAICVDVARESMQLFNSGADVQSIRAAIEKKWSPQYQNKTPTPMPPAKKP
jgi:hypothetical protein